MRADNHKQEVYQAVLHDQFLPLPLFKFSYQVPVFLYQEGQELYQLFWTKMQLVCI